LILREATERGTPDRIAQALIEAMAEGRMPAGPQAVAALAEMVPAPDLPTLLFSPPRTGVVGWLAEAARMVAELVAAAPVLAAAVAVEAADAEALSQAGPPSHALAVLREGLVPVKALAEAELADRLRSADVGPASSASARRLAEDGASEELAAAFAEVARRTSRMAAREEEEAARSAAERFLFERLETLRMTAGLFALNQTLDFHHGPAPAEVDLLAASLRLAVELDGSYYHLRDQTAYRRDRRKDWELQRRGYLVLRFLSEDVVARLEEILDTILAAVELRRASQPAQGPPA
jgi:very-short-patch-repair endonuclease